VILAVLVACSRIFLWLAGVIGRLHGPYQYNRLILIPNYFNVGFMRRGLGGTIRALLGGGDGLTGLAAFHVFCAVFLAVPLALLLRRLAAAGGWQWLYFGMVLVLSPQLMMAWAVDPGRGDMMNCGFVAWALLAALDRRFLVAAVVLFVGSLVHETVVILGLGLLVPICFLLHRTGSFTLRQGIAALALLGVLLVSAALLQNAYGPKPQDIVRVIVEHAPPSMDRDLAAYMTAAGGKSITTSACISFQRPAAILTIVAGFVILLAYVFVLQFKGRTALLVFAFAALLPMAALSIVAIDYGRWLCMAVMNAWLAAVALRLLGETEATTFKEYALGSAIGLGLLAMGHSREFYANAMIERIAFRVWDPRSEWRWTYMDRCDPAWRVFTGDISRTQNATIPSGKKGSS
jgi:hypothetical protein